MICKESVKIGKAIKKQRAELKANIIDTADVAFVENNDYEESEEGNESGSEIENDTSTLSHDAKSTSNAGWADVMQKILRTNKPKRKKTVVLAKAKKLCDIKVKDKKEDTPFEINNIEDVTKTEPKKVSVETENIVQIKQKTREKHLGIRIKPSIADRQQEKMLQKIATKGVVQLFNAVKQQQTEIDKKLSEAGPLDRKRTQVLQSINKNSFLDILMGGTKSMPVDNPDKSDEQMKDTNNKDKDDKVWSVLRDDFVMGAKLKDWDKKKDGEEEDSSAPEDMDSDMD